jgi:TetR/AcrR family transcriptional regulator, lmrAB and yxaGH operons repressor
VSEVLDQGPFFHGTKADLRPEKFRTWRERLGSLLVDGGCPAPLAPRFAALTIAAMDCAVAMARAEGDLEPFELASRQLLDMVHTN